MLDALYTRTILEVHRDQVPLLRGGPKLGIDLSCIGIVCITFGFCLRFLSWIEQQQNIYLYPCTIF